MGTPDRIFFHSETMSYLNGRPFFVSVVAVITGGSRLDAVWQYMVDVSSKGMWQGDG